MKDTVLDRFVRIGQVLGNQEFLDHSIEAKKIKNTNQAKKYRYVCKNPAW